MTPTDGFNDLDSFCVAAIVKGYLPADEDDEYYDHMLFRWRAWHALGAAELRDHAVEMLGNFECAPDDEMVFDLAERWDRELNEARLVSLGKRGRRPKKEIDWVRFRLYNLVAAERPATVRAVFYRAVSTGMLPKDDRAYNLVQRQLLTMRQNGLLPWGWITDSSRIVRRRARFKNLAEYARWVQSNYRADYWANLNENVEVWCEKEALTGVLVPTVVDEFGLELHISKGQSSDSYIYEAAEDIRHDGRPTTVYVLADFDPGGFRIAGAIEKKLRKHLGDYPLTVQRIAVSHEQIGEFGLLTRPVKKSDNQAPAFMARYGDVSCELEAIAPSRLRALVREHLELHMHQGQLRALKLAEEQEREGLAQLEDLLRGAT